MGEKVPVGLSGGQGRQQELSHVEAKAELSVIRREGEPGLGGKDWCRSASESGEGGQFPGSGPASGRHGYQPPQRLQGRGSSMSP